MGISILLAGILCFFLFYGRVPTVPLFMGALGLCLVFYFFQKKHRHSHGGFLSIDSWAQRSRLNRIHPGLKAAFAVGCALVCVAADSLSVSLVVAVTMFFLTVGVGKTPVHYYLTLLMVPVVFLMLSTVAILFEVSMFPLGFLDISLGRWYLCVTRGSQMKALSILCKAFGAVSSLYLLSLSTPMHQILHVLRKAKIPGIVVELMYLIYRYIFILLERQNHMKIAAQSRLGYRNWRISLKTMLNSSMNLLFLSFRQSSDCFAAMESRCYDGEIKFFQEETKLGKLETGLAVGYGFFLLILWIVSRRMFG